jgi:hypothetical protein
MDRAPGNLIVGPNRLYATLRLVLPETDASIVAHNLSRQNVSDDAIKGLVRSAEIRLFREYALRLVRRLFGRGEVDLSFVERLRQLTPYPSLLLALHLGLGLDAQQLAYLFNGHPDPIARELLHARLKLLEIPEHQCKMFPEMLGRYRDAAQDVQIRATLSSHIVRCARCRILIDQFEAMDAELMTEVNALEATVPRTGLQPRASRAVLSAAPFAVLLSLLGIAILLATGLATGLVSGPSRGVSLAMDAGEPAHQGRLLLGTWDGSLQSFDVATGQRRTVLDARFDGAVREGAQFLLSPNGEMVAIFAQSQAPGLHWSTREVEIVDLHGEQLHHIRWQHSVDMGWPTAWLNDREIVLLTIPSYEQGESAERFLQRLEQDGRIRAVDIETGEFRELARGAASRVFPSPDGTRVAVVKPYDPREPGITVTLHAVDASGFDEPILTIPAQHLWDGGLAWSPDSQHFYIGLITDYVESAEDGTNPGMLGDFRGRITRIDLHMVGRDGDTRQITEVDDGYFARILGVAPDGQRILIDGGEIFEDGNEREGEYDVWLADRDASNRVPVDLLTGPDDQLWRLRSQGEPASLAWSFDGHEFILFVTKNHFMPVDQSLHQGQFRGVYVTAYDEDLSPSIVSVLSQNWRVTPLRWISDEPVERAELAASERSGLSGNLEPAGTGRGDVRLGPESRRSPDGRAITMFERVSNMNRPFLWFPVAQTGRWLAPRTTDLGWFDDGQALLAVTTVQDDQGEVSRITQHNAGRQGGSSVETYFDPAGVGDSTTQRYALPMPSSDGTRAAFYVIYTDRTPVDLWVASADGSVARQYTFLSSPRGRRIANLTGQWVGADTFLFTEPLEWNEGLPVRSGLMQLRLLESGEPEIDLLFEVEARGRDFGVAITEFEVDPTGSHLAYRVRHHTSRRDHAEAYDTIHIASTSNVRQSLEVQRGEPGSGLTWSPDGGVLAIGIDERVGLYHMVNHTFEYATERVHRARYPVWVSNNELWFSRGGGRSAEVFRVWVQ